MNSFNLPISFEFFCENPEAEFVLQDIAVGYRMMKLQEDSRKVEDGQNPQHLKRSDIFLVFPRRRTVRLRGVMHA